MRVAVIGSGISGSVPPESPSSQAVTASAVINTGGNAFNAPVAAVNVRQVAAHFNGALVGQVRVPSQSDLQERIKTCCQC